MAKFSFFLLILFLVETLQAQTNTGSFLLIRSYGRHGITAILESSVYEKNADKIKIDPAKLEQYGSYEVYIMSQANKVMKVYKLKDSTGLILGNLKDSLKHRIIRYGMGADFKFSNLMADSLLREGVYFFSEPELATNDLYELNFSGFVNFPITIKTSDGKQLAKTLYSYDDFRDYFMQEFAYLGKRKAHMTQLNNGEICALIYLKDRKFDFKNLDKFQLKWKEKPYFRTRLCEIMILEE